jgi:hypothetical protein
MNLTVGGAKMERKNADEDLKTFSFLDGQILLYSFYLR